MESRAISQIEVLQGDITQIAVDAIVNAANERMLGGGGVDGAIHRAAGGKLLEACRAFPEKSPGVRCPTGTACATQAYNLPAKFVIHTVGPIWDGGGYGERELLASCYRHSIWLAMCLGVRTISFPAISCGVYAFPIEEAAQISVQTIRKSLSQPTGIQSVKLVAFDDQNYAAWQRAIG